LSYQVYSEAFPYSVVEAMMMGKPVISTDVGGISEANGRLRHTGSASKP
jgi:glycosyltransferase involved in cell wall biosynthesis